MSEQLSFPGNADKEQEFYNNIKSDLEAVVINNNLPLHLLDFKKLKGCYSLKFQGNLVFSLKYGKKVNWLRIPYVYKKTIAKYTFIAIANKSLDYFQIELSLPTHAFDLRDMLCDVLEQTIDAYAKTFSCCSKYKECSQKGKCIHSDPEIVLECSYRIKMKHGKVFY